MLGGKQSLDVLHHEYSRTMNLDDSQILLVEKVLFVLVKILVVCTPGSPAREYA